MKVEFLFDFGSPNAYLCHRVIPEIERRTGVTVAYVPILLGGIFKATGNRSPVEVYAGVENKNKYDALETERFCAEHGITDFSFNPFFPINTLVLMRGAIAARKLGVFEPYVDAVYRYMWSDPRNLNDPSVIGASLTEAGLDAAALIAKSQDPEVKQELVQATQEAVERGAFGSPTFYVDDEMYFGKDRLHMVVAEIEKRKAETA
ncbi:disulfide bond formation protein DsbA [Sulfitobacter sp. EhC04]|uniref:2-hydroxychromene-2-carboxylate isomerase n=1 Tax=Sulfitobacter sp. EhC04 TaxID=1849168 RepID=UPI0007F3EEBF|nr:2-hydroxychromene-2-carboxylate isomerase [Sulfitobacter sp. EhC04]OAN78651.1 disulfide bond formation protein DsbA [Sulfitobacter sp. EhC04]